MKSLLKDIEEIKYNSNIENTKILFEIKCYSHLSQILEKLYEINYCSNYIAWQRKIYKLRDVFNNQYPDYIELDVQRRLVTYSAMSKLKEQKEKSNKITLIASNYFSKMPRKKLIL